MKPGEGLRRQIEDAKANRGTTIMNQFKHYLLGLAGVIAILAFVFIANMALDAFFSKLPGWVTLGTVLTLTALAIGILVWQSDHLLKPGSNLCAKCGYDLRATPNRCPECGTIPAAKK